MKKYLIRGLKIIFTLIPPALITFTYLVILRPKPFRKIADFFVRFLIPPFITLPEGIVFLDQKDVAVSGGLSMGIHEPIEIELFRKSIRPGMVVIDIGANLGYYSVIAAGAVGPTGKVFAYEPEEKNFALLSKNTQANAFTWLTPLKIGLSNSKGTNTLYLADDHTGIHSFINNRNATRTLTISTETLDDSLKAYGSPQVDVIKIDIEGVDILALEGMKETIERSPQLTIFTELYPQAITRLGRKPIELLQIFSDQGFSVSIIDENTKTIQPLQPSQFEQFITDFPTHGEVVRNIYAVKN